MIYNACIICRLIVFTKKFIADVQLDSKYVSDVKKLKH